MNILIYETLPKNLFNSLTVDGGFMVAIVVAFANNYSFAVD